MKKDCERETHTTRETHAISTAYIARGFYIITGSQFRLFPHPLHDNASKRTSIAPTDIVPSGSCFQLADATLLSTSDRETRNARRGFSCAKPPVTIPMMSLERSGALKQRYCIIGVSRKTSWPRTFQTNGNILCIILRELNTKLNYGARTWRDGKLATNEDIKVLIRLCIAKVELAFVFRYVRRISIFYTNIIRSKDSRIMIKNSRTKNFFHQYERPRYFFRFQVKIVLFNLIFFGIIYVIPHKLRYIILHWNT